MSLPRMQKVLIRWGPFLGASDPFLGTRDASLGATLLLGTSWPFPGICQSCVTYLTKAAIPTIEIDYLLNFTTGLPFLLLLLASK